MKKTITTKGLTLGSIIKLLFYGFLVPILPIGIGVGISAFLGHDTVMLYNQYVHGASGLLTGIVLGVILPAFMAAIYGLLAFIGIWIWTRFTTIDLSYKE